jgi:hypothetical protein
MKMRGLIFSMLVMACSQPPVQEPVDFLFQSISSAQTGIDFNNQLTENENFNIIEYLYFYNGGGVAVGDINNDGLVDIYFSSNQQANRLYLNKGNLQFEDITESAGVASGGPWKTGVSMVDINGDGLLDIYVCRVSGYKGLKGRNELYINNGDLTFTESARDYGLDFEGFSTHAAFFDYDGDGDLDMYLLNHAVHTERSYGRASLRFIDDGQAGDKLYRNNAEKGEKRFTPVTNEAGIFSSQVGYGLGVGIADVNNDGWPDIYVSNDFNENDYLYINQGDGTFVESIRNSISYSSRFSMGNDLADINNDGWVDIMTLDMLPENEMTQKMSFGEDPYEIYKLKLNFGYERQASRNMLQLNQGNGKFSEIAQLAGVHATDWSWAVLLADFDNDGLNDIFISNGIVRRPNDIDYINFITEEKSLDQIKNLTLAQKMPDGAVPNFFYRNQGNYSFEDVSGTWINPVNTLSNGAVYADLDNDGDLDLIVNHVNQKAGIYRNQTIEKNGREFKNYLTIKFKGEGQNTFGIGTRVKAYIEGKEIMRDNFTSRGFQSSVAPEIHLGLGQGELIDSLLVIWPDQSFQKLFNVPINQAIWLNQSEAGNKFEYPKITKTIVREEVDLKTAGIEFSHVEDDYNDFNLEPLIPHKLSHEGPAACLIDINGDGKEDVFLGGALGQESVIYLQEDSGKFTPIYLESLVADAGLEDVTALWEDIDQDGLPDLIVGRGGNIPKSPHGHSDSKFYKNLGNGKLAEGVHLPLDPNVQVSCLLSIETPHIVQPTFFVGGRNIAGNYGEIPKSYLLQWDSDKGFLDVTQKLAPELQHIGKVKAAVMADLNQNGINELILAGEWMSIKVFAFANGQLLDQSDKFGLSGTEGWWNTLKVEDINGDGYPDLIMGNLGLNTRIPISEGYPFRMWVKDLDDNGSGEHILGYAIENQYYPLANRDELAKKIPVLNKKFILNKDFAGKTLSEIFKNYSLEEAMRFEARHFSSKVFLNQNGIFKAINLPEEAQFAPIQTICVEDLDKDGYPDLVLGGNMVETAPYFGAYLGSWGSILKGDGQGNFVPFAESSLGLSGQIQNILSVKVKSETWHLFIKNDDQLQILKFKDTLNSH